VPDKILKKKIAILQVLKSAGEPMSSARITEALQQSGQDVSERTVRLYLQQMEERQLIRSNGRRGRVITEAGLEELHAEALVQRVGLLSAKIDQMTYRMSFDLQMRSGAVLVNTSIVDPEDFTACIDEVCEVFARGYAMGTLAGLLGPGESIGELTVPDGMLGFCTVCSITLNGVLLKHGVPTHSRFGGLLQLAGGEATRFVEMIHYDGTSIDPLEVFIRSGMTNYLGAIQTGDGRVGASFRELPADSRALVVNLAERLDRIGLGGFLCIGHPGRPLMDLPVSEGRIGAVVIGGLNPIAILEERGRRVQSRALAGLMEYNRLFSFRELPDRVREAAR
jgi:hypothetical protein